MAETIKGINVVIGSDTTGLSAALSDVNKKSKDIQSELKQVEKLLKLDPTNTDLLAQKQKLLGEAVANTSEKLDRLHAAQQQVNEQFAKGDISEGQYRAFQREVAKTEQELRGLKSQLDGTTPELKKLGDEAESASNKFKKIGDGLKGAGEKLSLGITAPVAGIVALATEGTEETRKFMARLETNAQAAGASLDDVHGALRDLNAITGETDSNVEALSNLLAAGFKGDQFKQALDQLSGAAIKFSDTLKIEGLADGLQETLATGAAIGPFAELLDRSGVSLDNFNAGLAEATKNGQQQQYVLQQLSELGLAEVNEQYRQNNQELVENANAQYDMQQALAELGKTLLPIVTMIAEKIGVLLNWFNGLDDGTKKVIMTLVGIAAAVGPVLIVIGQLITAVTSIMTAFSAVSGVISAAGGVMAALTGPVGLVIAGIAAVAAGAYLVIKNWDAIKSFFSDLWDWVKDFFSQWGGLLLPLIAPFLAIPLLIVKHWEDIKAGLSALWKWIKDTAIELFNNTKDGFIQIWDGIKDYFSGVWKLIKNIFAGALLLIIDLVTGDFGKLKTDAIAIWNNLKDALSQVWEGIKKMFAGSLDVIKGSFATAWNTIKSVAFTIWTEITDGIERAIEWIKNLPQTMTELGKNMIQGLIDGIKNMIGKVGEVVKSIADKVTGGLRNALDIHSPSRVLMQLGEFTGEGFAKGLGNSITDVKQQVSAMASVATDVPGGAGGAAAGAVYNFDGMFAGVNFTVRNDSDVKRIAQELFNMQQTAMRGAAVR